jgi:nucleoid-associated protein YgaU
MAWAENNDISKDYPAEYKEAAAAMQGAELAYANKRYAPATELAGEVTSILSDDFQAQVLAEREQAAAAAAAKADADAAMGDAKTRMAWAENNEISKDYPAEYKEASAAMQGAELAYANERYAPAATLAGEVSSILSDDFMNKVLASRSPEAIQAAQEEAKKAEEAQKAADANDAAKDGAFAEIENAQARYDWAKANNAGNNYPDLLAKGGSDLAKAKQSYDSGNYVDASAMAKEAMKSLSNIKAFAPLPAVYIVRLIPERRDCLWRIAEYPFIYNNPLKWPVLYEANKKTFRDPSNPDLIFPDQVLNIPAIKGESRSGTWDPKKTYNPLPKK